MPARPPAGTEPSPVAPAGTRLRVVRVPLASLVPDPGNARTHPQANLDVLVASLRRFGQAEPLVVQAGTRRVVAGHGRLMAMQALGWTECDVVELELSGTDATALGIALNRSADLASWDDQALARILEQLRAEDGGLDGVGYSSADLDALLDELQRAAGEVSPDLDAVPAPPAAATTRPGDLWVLGSHRLLCGDSASPADLDRLLAGAPVHLVNTDPPYNVRVEPRSNNAIAAGLSSFTTTHHQKLDVQRHPEKAAPTHARLRAKDRPLANDFVSDEAFAQLLAAWFGNLARVLLPGRAAYIWGGYSNCGNYPPALKAAGLYFSQAIIWDKQHPVLTRKDYMGAHEWCFYGWREGAGHEYFGPANATDLWAVKKVNPQSMVHLCLHPEALVLTDEGYRSIQTITVGARVLAADGRFHEVSAVTSHAYQSKELVRIVAKGGNIPTLASDNHPFLIWRPEREGRSITGGEVRWIRADEIEVGDYTMTPELAESEVDPFPERDKEYWFLFGLYLAQGSLQKAGHGPNRYPSFHIHKRRQDLVARIHARFASVGEYDPGDYGERSQGLTVMAFDPGAGEEFERLGGRGSHTKRIHPEVFDLPRAKRQAVFDGWLNGDGCRVRDRNYWQGNTCSFDLAAGLALLAESTGYRSTLFRFDPPVEMGMILGRRIQSHRPVYQLYFYARDPDMRRGAKQRVEHDGQGFTLRYVKSVERVPYGGEVWNLSVEGCHSFQTSVGCSHNTEKPVELASRAILYSSRRGEHVLDLFGGSGSTLIACEETQRLAHLMELDPLYCDVIVLRWQRLTGRPATLDGTGQTFEAVAEERGTARPVPEA